MAKAPVKTDTCGAEDIATLFPEWSAVDYGDGSDEAAVQRAIKKASKIEKRMLAVAPVTAADLARQLIASTGNGDFMLDRDFYKKYLRPIAFG